jgi:uncharacterized protein (TIGR04442 family)
MIRDVHISGSVSERHEYYTTAIGPHLNLRLIHDGRAEPGRSFDRFFSGGNEIRVTSDGVGHTGTGGAFCSYMFGVDIPEKDLLRSDVRNRLVMHGARYDEEHDRLVFSNDTAGFETFSRVFNEGHAFANHYFFVVGDLQGNLRATQESLLRVAGKFLKRQDLNTSARDARDLAAALHEAFGVPAWTLFLVKIVDVNAEAFYDRFKGAYRPGHDATDDERQSFDLLARHYEVDAFRRERITLDVIYEHDDNKRVVDAYKEALVAHLEHKMPEHALLPKLNLLRAFAARNRAPSTIFDRLDSVLTDLGGQRGSAEPPFVAGAREILENLFVRRIGSDLDAASIVRLLHAKRQAMEQRYVGFESVLLDAAHASDEWARLGKSLKLRAQFEQLIDYLDLFDRASTLVNSIAFIDDFEVTPPRLEELVESQKAFDELRPGLFAELFLTPLARNAYVGAYGRRRIDALAEGLASAAAEPASAREIPAALARIAETARLHRLIDAMLREAVGDVQAEPLDDAQKGMLRRDVETRLRTDFGVTAAVDAALFDAVLRGIEREQYYTSELLPKIVATHDLALRESFLSTSGLDLFRVEEIEAAYAFDLKPNAMSSAGG